jgi:hypothetical protein
VQDVWFNGQTGSPWNLQQLNTTKNKAGMNGKAPPAAPGSLFVSVYNPKCPVSTNCAPGQHHWGYIDQYGGLQDVWFNGQTGNPWNLQQLNMK